MEKSWAENRESAAPAGRPGRRRAQGVLDAAAAVFAEKGFPAAITQDIADVLGMRQASLYYYFRSKESALEQVCTAGATLMIERAEAVSRARLPSRMKLERLIVVHLEIMRDHAAYVRVFLHERRYLKGPTRRRIARLADRIESILQQVLESGVRSGEFRADLDPHTVTLAVLGMINTARTWYGKLHAVSIDELCRQMTTLVLAGVSAPTPPPRPSARSRPRA